MKLVGTGDEVRNDVVAGGVGRKGARAAALHVGDDDGGSGDGGAALIGDGAESASEGGLGGREGRQDTEREKKKESSRGDG